MQDATIPEVKVKKRSALTFDLRSIFYVISLLASGIAISPGTIAATLLILVFWFACFAAIRARVPKINLLLVAIGFIFLMCCSGMLMPPVNRVREAARRMLCINNMKQLGLAMHNFHATNQQFPDAKKVVLGNPHSWRVSILPELEQQQLFQMYDYGKTWDSPTNNKLAQIAISCMTCPSCDNGSKTPYKLVTGPGTIFEEGKIPRIDRIRDGTSNTIIMIEDHRKPVAWTDPNGNISVEDAVEILSNLPFKNAIHRSDEAFKTIYHGTHVLTADGAVHRIGFNADREELRRAFLCADGMSGKNINSLGEPLTVINYGKIVATIVYSLMALAPVVPLIREYRANESETRVDNGMTNDGRTN